MLLTVASDRFSQHDVVHPLSGLSGNFVGKI
jgi:hypothetical protein